MKNYLNLKNALVAMFVIGLGFFSCKKITEKNTLQKYIPLIDKTITLANLNDESQRLATELEDAKYNLSVNASAVFGKYPASLNDAVVFGGFTPNNLQLNLNGYNYQAAENGGWYREGDEFKTFFDKDLTGNITNGSFTKQFAFHSPKLIAFEKLGASNSLFIEKTGNIMHWEADVNNPTEKVVLSIKCFDNDELGEVTGLVYSDIFLLEDNGSYDISSITSKTGIKRITIELGRGNGVSFVDEVKGNTFFNVKSSDYHEYLINQ